MEKSLLCIGYGYTAQVLTARLASNGWRVTGTTRDAKRLKDIEQTGANAALWPDINIADFANILISAAPSNGQDPVLATMRDKISDAAKDMRWVGYLSTTAVYGDHSGAWVDEDTPLRPGTQRGADRVAAETAWQSIPDLPLHIFRLGGIYGPGRGPFAKLRAGTARRIVKPGQVFSRAHVDDIAAVLALSLQTPQPGSVYNICDDAPAPPEDVIAYAADLLGLPLPEAEDFASAEMTPMARSFYAENKRIRNTRARSDLGWTPQFPSYREGLKDLLIREG